MDNDGRLIPVGPEILQRYDEAVKRFNENRAQAKAKAAPRGGVTASMIILESEDIKEGVVVNAVKTPDSDQHCAMVNPGTNAIIVPLHPAMRAILRSVKFQVRQLLVPQCKSLSTKEPEG